MIRSLFHRHKPHDPCPHMERLLQATAEDKASRFVRWYALAHAARCTPCRKFLERLEQMLDALKMAKSEKPDPAILARLAKIVAETNTQDSHPKPDK